MDRLRRRPILIGADLGRAVVLGIIPLAAMLHRLTIGDLAGGAIAQVMGVRQALLIGAIGVLLSTMWLVFSPVRRLRELPHARRK